MQRISDAQRRVAVVLALVFAAGAANFYWWRLSVPVVLADAPGKRIACVSYAPYRRAGETPFDANLVVSPARIDEDLTALSRRFDCVRTYSVSAGLGAVPAIARRHGMHVLLGIWLSRTPLDNERELARGIALANENRDVVEAVIVGNEVLLRGELPERTLAGFVRRVRDATGLPVTYADVWEFWLKYPEIEKAVSFVTIHILPYWEDEPVGVGDALAHVKAIRARMQAAFPGRDILIGETGWPSAGRQRREAVPSLVNQARYIREFLEWAETSGIRYNVIEAFDQPWKRQLEGTVGGYWGLYDDQLREKFPLQGPVVEEPRWLTGIEAGLALALVYVVLGGLFGQRSIAGMTVLLLGGDAVGAILYAQLRHMGLANRNLAESILTNGLSLIALASASFLCLNLARWVASPHLRRPTVVPYALWIEGYRSGASGLAVCFGCIRFVWLFAASVMDLLLVFDARYRDFPTLLFATPWIGLCLCALLQPRAVLGREVALEERFCALWLLLASVWIIIAELPTNTSADLWVALCVIVAWVVLTQTRTSNEALVLAAPENQSADGHGHSTRFVAVQDQGGAADRERRAT